MWTALVVGAGLTAAAAAGAALMTATAAAAATGLAPTTRVSVKPGSGDPATTFTLGFRIPDSTGTFGSVIRRDTLSVSGPPGAACVARATMTLRAATRGARLTVKLNPAQLGGQWCPGEFRGQIRQQVVVHCAPQPVRACPQLLVAPLTIARFQFRVRPATGAGPAPGPASRPAFAGLITATTCNSLAPQILPRPASYTLTWEAATDPVTPRSAIVYDVFLATTPGAENYSQPTWTTSPGVTSFTTPDVPHSGAVYFVVRARDNAGNEDDNTVERQGVSQCS